ncbi:hypothetical protein [Roseivirga sp. E12]|uniref:hypothetical protein n=1 Tax=Roseivirga sp. E12 TaxID=2819237 RepID=UPI001ABC94FD|nr:hypothetical protein [Roseivirga sp. E12]MBO3697660.1 hypothetical protein [Roseivirga sp. E12]
MKNLSLILVLVFTSVQSNTVIQDNKRTEELDRYWKALAKTAKAGDFEGMRSLYHEDAVLVKEDTTIAISEAFKFRWKKEILEVRDGKRANTLEFRFSKRVGNHITAYEEGIYHYTSVKTSTGKSLGDSYIHFETLLVKVNDNWLTLMEYQKTEASEEEWAALK